MTLMIPQQLVNHEKQMAELQEKIAGTDNRGERTKEEKHYERMLKMKSVMRDLYYKRLLPCELSHTHGAEYDELRCKIESVEQYFTSKLSVDDYQRFEDYKKLLWQLNSVNDIDTFSQAFKLGTVLMMEMFFDEIEFPDS